MKISEVTKRSNTIVYTITSLLSLSTEIAPNLYSISDIDWHEVVSNDWGWHNYDDIMDNQKENLLSTAVNLNIIPKGLSAGNLENFGIGATLMYAANDGTYFFSYEANPYTKGFYLELDNGSMIGPVEVSKLSKYIPLNGDAIARLQQISALGKEYSKIFTKIHWRGGGESPELTIDYYDSKFGNSEFEPDNDEITDEIENIVDDAYALINSLGI